MKGTTGGIGDGKRGCAVTETAYSAERRMAALEKEGRRLAMTERNEASRRRKGGG